MAEQAIDMRSFFSNFRHHRTAVAAAVLLGAGAGAGLVVAMPPQYSSQSLVLLPPVQASDGGQPTSRNSATEVKIASSDAVLGPAGAKVTPQMSTREVKKTVEISAPTDDVIQVEAYAGTRADPEQHGDGDGGAVVAEVGEERPHVDGLLSHGNHLRPGSPGVRP